MEATSERKSADRPDASGEAPTKSESISSDWLLPMVLVGCRQRQVYLSCRSAGAHVGGGVATASGREARNVTPARLIEVSRGLWNH